VGLHSFTGKNSVFFESAGRKTVTGDSREVIRFLEAQTWGYKPFFFSATGCKPVRNGPVDGKGGFSEAAGIDCRGRNGLFSTPYLIVRQRRVIFCKGFPWVGGVEVYVFHTHFAKCAKWISTCDGDYG
jgi:hypothetical protein